MSLVALTTIGTVLSRLIAFMLVPLVARGGVVLAAMNALWAMALGFWAGRAAAWGVAPWLGVTRGEGPIWAGWMPVRGPDMLIFGFFVVLTLAMVVLTRRNKDAL